MNEHIKGTYLLLSNTKRISRGNLTQLSKRIKLRILGYDILIKYKTEANNE